MLEAFLAIFIGGAIGGLIYALAIELENRRKNK